MLALCPGREIAAFKVFLKSAGDRRKADAPEASSWHSSLLLGSSLPFLGCSGAVSGHTNKFFTASKPARKGCSVWVIILFSCLFFFLSHPSQSLGTTSGSPTLPSDGSIRLVWGLAPGEGHLGHGFG